MYQNPQITLTITVRVCLSVQSVIVSVSYVKLWILSTVCIVLRRHVVCITIHRPEKKSNIIMFFHHTRTLFAAALGIEILCISAAEIGENSAFYFFGYHLQGIILGYIMGYAAAGFTTFMTILGRYDLRNTKIESCCSVL